MICTRNLKIFIGTGIVVITMFSSCSKEDLNSLYYKSFYEVLQNTWELEFADTLDATLNIYSIEEYHRTYYDACLCPCYFSYCACDCSYDGYWIKARLRFEDGFTYELRGFNAISQQEYEIDLDWAIKWPPGTTENLYAKPELRLSIVLNPDVKMMEGSLIDYEKHAFRETWSIKYPIYYMTGTI